MNIGSTGTYLHLVRATLEEQPGTATTYEVHASARTHLEFTRIEQEVAEHCAHSLQWWSDDRTARVAMLRARIKSGTYTVDSMTLASYIIKDENPLCIG